MESDLEKIDIETDVDDEDMSADLNQEELKKDGGDGSYVVKGNRKRDKDKRSLPNSLSFEQISNKKTGIPALLTTFHGFKVENIEGNELENLNRIFRKFKTWQREMAPQLSFFETMLAFEKSTSTLKKQQIRNYLNELRDEEYHKRLALKDPNLVNEDNVSDMEDGAFDDDQDFNNDFEAKVISGQEFEKNTVTLKSERASDPQFVGTEKSLPCLKSKSKANRTDYDANARKESTMTSDKVSASPSLEIVANDVNTIKRANKRLKVIDSDDESDSADENMSVSMMNESVHELNEGKCSQDATQYIDNSEWSQDLNDPIDTQVIDNETWTQNP